MGHYVYILGAGASVWEGAPLLNDFLEKAESLNASGQLSLDEKEAFDRVLKGYYEMQQVYAKASLEIMNIEDLFTAFEMAAVFGRLGTLKQKEINALPFAIKKVIRTTLLHLIDKIPCEGMFGDVILVDKVGVPASYNKFMMHLESILIKNKVSIISFNYDLCIDIAMSKYKYEEQKKAGSLYKLHGSLDLFSCPECKEINKVPYGFKITNKNNSYGSVIFQVEDTNKCLTCDYTGELEPFIVPPTLSKIEYQMKMKSIWSKAAEALSQATDIVIVGYSLPETDQFFKYFYALGTMGPSIIRNIHVVNTDNSSEFQSRYKTLLGPLVQDKLKFMDVIFYNFDI